MVTTLKDVAEKAGVSVKTVSRVVNNQGEISAQTREHVSAVLDELGYRPNALRAVWCQARAQRLR